MRGLSQRQRDTLLAIERFTAAQGRSPTVTELGPLVGCAVSNAYRHVVALELKGYVKRAAFVDRKREVCPLPATEV